MRKKNTLKIFIDNNNNYNNFIINTDNKTILYICTNQPEQFKDYK